MATATQLEAAYEAYLVHDRLFETGACACGKLFELTWQGAAEHAKHRIAETVTAAEVADVFCDQCEGPYEGWLKQYGGHWDTCPNRATAIVDVSPEFYDGWGACPRCGVVADHAQGCKLAPEGYLTAEERGEAEGAAESGAL